MVLSHAMVREAVEVFLKIKGVTYVIEAFMLNFENGDTFTRTFGVCCWSSMGMMEIINMLS